MSLTVSITSRVVAEHAGVTDLSELVDRLDSLHRIDLTPGTGTGQADLVWHDRRTLAASGTEDLDLAGSLADVFGSVLTFARIKAIKVAASAGNTNSVTVARPAANGVPLFLAAGDGIPVPPGGVFEWAAPGAGIAVTAGTGDLLTVANSGSGTPVTYDIVVIGASA